MTDYDPDDILSIRVDITEARPAIDSEPGVMLPETVLSLYAAYMIWSGNGVERFWRLAGNVRYSEVGI